MNVTTDKISQATYISFSDEKVFKTRTFLNSKIIVDFGSKNRILGIEILSPIFSYKRLLESKLDKWHIIKNFSRPKKVEPTSVVSVSERIQNVQ